MTPIQRSRRLQTGLASLGIVGAVGASFGIGAATHTASTGGSSGGGASGAGTSAGHHSHSPGRSHVRSHHSTPTRPQQVKPSVTAPKPNPPQATTSGS